MTGSPHAHTRCAIVPPYLLVRLARLDDPRFAAAAEAARQSLMRDAPIRDLRAAAHPSQRPSLRPGSSGAPARGIIAPDVRGRIDRTISDAAGLERLPGRPVRSERQGPVADPAVQEGWGGLGSTHALFWALFERDSIDDRGLPL
ncbi:MAG: peptidase M4 family protein, partial [Ramlibacter sp.]|nr:peptidase M4 family protein [Cryobacterium sp.]